MPPPPPAAPPPAPPTEAPAAAPAATADAPTPGPAPREAAPPLRLVWLDLEMTGLDPEGCVILEVAAVVTGADLVPLGQYEAVVWQPEEALARMVPVVREMHTRNGLIERVRASQHSLRDVELHLVRLVASHCGPGEGVLAGSSIHADRRFLIRHMPMLDRFLTYRMVDVSSLTTLTRAWYPGAQERTRGPSDHTAMADIRASIAELAHARDTFFLPPDALLRPAEGPRRPDVEAPPRP